MIVQINALHQLNSAFDDGFELFENDSGSAFDDKLSQNKSDSIITPLFEGKISIRNYADRILMILGSILCLLLWVSIPLQ